MAEESLIEKALDAILPGPKKRTAKKPTHAARLSAVQKKLAQLSRDVEKLGRLVAQAGKAGGAAKKTITRTAKPARATTKKTAARRKVRVKKPLKKS